MIRRLKAKTHEPFEKSQRYYSIACINVLTLQYFDDGQNLDIQVIEKPSSNRQSMTASVNHCMGPVGLA